MTKEIEKIAKDKNFNAVNIGKFEDLKDYVLGEMKGKVFLKDSIESTATEISFQFLPAKTELPFFHTHKQNEEVYIILKGSGQFQVDDKSFPISEGSLVRVSPEGKRSLNNTSNEAMIYMVIQAKENSLVQWTMEDGNIVENTKKWAK